MFLTYQQSEATAARRRVPVHLVDATDGITPETGEAGGQPQISKNGGAFANTSATLTAIGNGAYYVELIATELDTLGFAIVRFKSAATAEFQVVVQVIPFDPYDAADLGLTNLDATVSSRLAASAAPTNFGDLAITASTGRVTVGTNNDKAGYALTQAFPTNFADMAITVTTGLVSVGTNNDKSGYTIAGTINDLDTLENISAADVNAQVDTALSDIGLDHLVSAAVIGTDVADNSIVARLAASGATADWDTFDNQTDSLQAVRDRGDAAWITATTVDLNADQSAVTVGTVNALGTQAKADVNAECVDVLFTDTINELAQAQPSATPSISTALMFLYMALRNETTTSASQLTIANNAGTVVSKQTLSETASVLTRAKFVSGP